MREALSAHENFVARCWLGKMTCSVCARSLSNLPRRACMAWIDGWASGMGSTYGASDRVSIGAKAIVPSLNALCAVPHVCSHPVTGMAADMVLGI